MNVVNEKELMGKLLSEIRGKIQHFKTERILITLLDNDSNIITSKIISEGYHRCYAEFYPHKLTSLLDIYTPAAAVWAHSHIENICYPSEADNKTTKWFVNECKKRNIIPYDDIIIMHENDKYYSNKEHNWSGKADDWAIAEVFKRPVY